MAADCAQELLKEAGVFCVFSDFCEEAAHRAVEAMNRVGAGGAASERGGDMQVLVNPFRRPFSSMSKDLHLPTYSNGFLALLNFSAL